MKLPKKLRRALFPKKKSKAAASPTAAPSRRKGGHVPSSPGRGGGYRPLTPDEEADRANIIAASSTVDAAVAASDVAPPPPPLAPSPPAKTSPSHSSVSSCSPGFKALLTVSTDEDALDEAAQSEGTAESSPVSVMEPLAAPLAPPTSEGDGGPKASPEVATPPSTASGQSRRMYSFDEATDSPCCSIIDGDDDSPAGRARDVLGKESDSDNGKKEEKVGTQATAVSPGTVSPTEAAVSPDVDNNEPEVSTKETDEGSVSVAVDTKIPPASEPQAAENEENEPLQPASSPATSATTDGSDQSAAPKPKKKVKFSLHGEHARQRAVARQRKILARAALRLDAISDTSLDTIQEATAHREELKEAAMGGRKSLDEIRRLRMQMEAEEAGDDASEGVASRASDDADTPLAGPSVSSLVFFQSPTGGNDGKGTKAPAPVDALEGRSPRVSDIVAQFEEGPWEENSSQASSAAKGAPVHFFALLLCPTSRIFELVELSAHPASTVADMIQRIPEECTDQRLRDREYVGFVRPKDRADFVCPDARAFGHAHGAEDVTAADAIREGDVLVAILEGRSGREMGRIAKPILKNAKFRDMVKRRGRKKGGRRGDDGSVRSSRSKRSSKSGRSRKQRHRSASKPMAGDSLETPPAKGKELCRKLEDLSKKLHDVDSEIAAGDDQDASSVQAGDDSAIEEVTGEAGGFTMTPKMVAYELAANIEDIFAGHDVDIVAVDAAPADDDTFVSDDDTFVSARSSRSMKSLRSVRSLIKSIEINVEDDGKGEDKAPVEIATKKKRERKPRVSKFDTYGEDDMMLQIEAMAAQADAAFESRKRNGLGAAIIEPTMASAATDGLEIQILDDLVDDLAQGAEGTENLEDNDDEEASKALDVTFDEEIEVTPENVLTAIKSIKEKEESADAVANYTASEKDAMSRNFLNTSTSMVSTMVAASQGRVNEVHVLQYLGVTIVCIAANFMQQGARKNFSPGGGPNPFGAKEVFQSACFLAFMVNGQRYLAKVTKR
ncbi:hypothetical protein ACHAXT_005025 [Thalassiosira profunda]